MSSTVFNSDGEDLVLNESGKEYKVIAQSEGEISPLLLANGGYRVIGTTTLETPDAEIIYNPLDDTITFNLPESNYYDKNYLVDLNDGNFVKTELTVVNPAVCDTVSVRNVVVNQDGTTATVYIYNAYNEEKTVSAKGVNGNLATEVQSVTIPAESVASVSFTGEALDKMVWQVW